MNASTATDYRTNLLVQADLRMGNGDRTAEPLSANLQALNGKAPSMTAKPNVTPQRCGSFLVKFGHGGRAEIQRNDNGSWSVFSLTSSVCGPEHYSIESAMRRASILTFIPDVFEPFGSVSEIHALAIKCNEDRNLYAKTIKRIAKARFGVSLSVRGGRGTAASWVDVRATKDGDVGAATIIHVVLGGGALRPCGGARVAIICALAGHPLPDGFEVRPPQWD